MAKNSTPPANDPAALAFSAVEDALKESVFNLEPTEKPEPDKKPAAEQPTARSERLRAATRIAAQANTVANDDRVQPSRILYDLQTRSSSTPTWVAIILSVVWLGATGAAGYLRYQDQLRDLSSFVGTLDFIGLVAL